MFTNVLDAPVSELAMGDDVDIGEYFFDAWALQSHCQYYSAVSLRLCYLVVFKTVLKDVLNDQTARLSEGNLVPHAPQGVVDILHDLRRRLSPTKLKELLPHMAGVTMNNSLRDAAQELMHHDCLVIFGDRVKRLLDHVASKRVHGKVQGVPSDGVRDLDHLLGSPMLKATLNQEVPEAIDHQGVRLRHDCLNNLILLLRAADLELLLKKDGRLLVIVANDLVHDVLPIGADVFIKESAIIERFRRWEVRWAFSRHDLVDVSRRLQEREVSLQLPHSSSLLSR